LKSPAGRRVDRSTRFYRIAAWSALAVAVIGFFLTYTLPMARGTFAGPRWSHVHGALLLAWLLLTIVQAHLAQGNLRAHRQVGWSALLLAPAVAASTILIGFEAAGAGLARGDGPIAISGLLGSVTAPLIFLLLVGLAIAKRRDPQWHKRAMFVATVAMLWPAWFRWRHFLPGIPRPEITLSLLTANVPLLIAMIRDRVLFAAVHPAYWILGLGLMAEQTFETFAFDTPAWRAVATSLYELGR
jgi:hypothetical protein